MYFYQVTNQLINCRHFPNVFAAAWKLSTLSLPVRAHVQEGTQAQSPIVTVSSLGRDHFLASGVTSAVRKGCFKHHGDRTVVHEDHDA